MLPNEALYDSIVVLEDCPVNRRLFAWIFLVKQDLLEVTLHLRKDEIEYILVP